jgi:hypothetical protein
MELSDKSGPADQQLVRYLLDLLPYEDSERLDQASIEDDDLAARLRVVEHDLIDAYVRGTLDHGTRERFESHYLASPLHRKRVRFAVNFLRAVDRAAAQEDTESDEDRAAGAPAHRRRSVRLKLVSGLTAVAAVVVVACGTLLLESVRSERGRSLAEAATATPAGDAQVMVAKSADAKPSDVGDGADLGDRARGARRESAASRPSPPAPRLVRIQPEALQAALLLLPQTRGVGTIPTLTIPAGTDRVAFELRLEANDAPRYRVELRNPATNQIVWRAGAIVPTSSGDQSSVFVLVPAGLLQPQHYSLDLTDRAAGADEIVGSYTFQVLAR